MLLECTSYKNGRREATLDVGQLTCALQGSDTFVWVALQDPTLEELAPLQAALGLHPLAVEDAVQGLQRPKVEEYGDALFVVLHLLEVNPAEPPHPPDRASSPRQLHRGQLAIFAGPNYVVSVRSRSEQNLSAVRARCEREPDLLRLGPAFVLYALMDEVVDRYFPAVDRIEDDLEAVEKKIFTERAGADLVHRLYALKRRLRVMRHAVVPLLDAAAKMHTARMPALCSPVQHYFRDVFDHLCRLGTAVEATRDNLDTAIQVHLSLVTIDDGEVTKRLAAWAAIFGVATTMVGVWGMNFVNMPELHWRWGYAMALGSIVGVCALLYTRLRRAGWL